MLSVVIETKNDEDPLARTLSSLVTAAVEGAVREVIVCDLGSTDQTHHVAEHAGCTFLTSGGIASAIGKAKSEWLLVMEPGARLLEGWAEHVADHTSRQTMAARFSRARTDRAPFLSRVFSSKRALADGLVITKRQAASLARNGQGAEALARGLATRRLPAQIIVAPARPD
ncbi:MAG: glycosyl transferase family 2 [Rhizobiaceae bacterium]|nr:glycosyl transferase family 2 [Rhizobiaceae bacterium]